MILLAIDPGVDSGWAIFFDGMLVGCGLGGEPTPLPPMIGLLVIEHPVIYPGGRTSNPNSIVKLAVNAGEWKGRFAARAGEIRMPEPRTWKGTMDPDICNARTLAKLDDGERMVFDDAVRSQKIPVKKRHNVIDAVGLGLYASGR